MQNKIKFLLPLILLVFQSCISDNYLYNEYIELDGNWVKGKTVKFEFTVKDTVKPLNLFINIRANNKYPFNNLFLIVKTHQPNKKVIVDTLEYQMTMPDGTLLGDGFTEVKESKLWFKENFSFSKLGKHIFEIEQANRETGKVSGVNNLKGITDIGLSIENTK